MPRMELLTKAKPSMERLARKCNETVYLAVPRGHEILMLHMVDSTHVVSTVPLVGNCYRALLNAAGRAIREGMVQIDSGGFGEGTACVAAPFWGSQSNIEGGLCIVGQEYRLARARITTELLPHLKEACEEVSTKLACLVRVTHSKFHLNQMSIQK